MVQVRKAIVTLAIVALPLLAGCSSTSSSPPPPPTNTIVYAAAFSNSGVQLDTFAYPISATSVVLASLSSGAPTTMADASAMLADSAGRIWVLNDTSTPYITVFTPPLSATSAPVATINLTGAGDAFHMAFDAAGNLWVASTTTNQVFEYNGPWGAITGTQTPVANVTLSAGLNRPEGLAFDTAGKLYVANEGSTTIFIWNTPLSGGASNGSLIGLTNPDAIAFDSVGNLYSGDANGNLARFNAGFAPGAAPNIVDPTATSTLNDSQNMSFDLLGNLFIADCGNTVSEFTSVATTFSATSAPAVRLPPPTFTCVGGVLVR